MKVILFGFRYSGKSVIGKTLAKKNGLKFIDVDDEIEKIAKKSINDIVKTKDGWKKVREIEVKVFNDVIKKDNIVVSCGGGFGVNNQLCEEKNMTFGEIERSILTKIDAIKVLLEINKDSLINRIKTSKPRPSFNNNNDVFAENINLYYSRKQSYNNLCYDVKIDTSYDNFVDALLNDKLYCVIGDPVWHSLSPDIHNNFYNKINNKDDKNFLYTKFNIKQTSFNKVIDILRLFKVQGASITSPFKQSIIKYLSKIDDESKKIEAVNTIIYNKEQNNYFGRNTDWFGVVEAIKNNTNNNFMNKRIAIFGSGGGAKSAVIGCLKYTDKIVMFNRTESKNTEFAKKHNIKSLKLKDFNAKKYDIIINATTVGLNNLSKSIISKAKIDHNCIVFDMVYNPLYTRFLKNAIDKNCKIIFGTEMLIFQAKQQFELFTNVKVENTICNKVLKQIQQDDHEKCIVVCGDNVKDFIKNIHKASKHSNLIELRVDYIKNVNKNDIKIIADEIKKINKEIMNKYNKLSCLKTIFTCRLLENGGYYNKDYLTYKSLVDYAMSMEIFDYFDFDISCIDMFKKKISDNKSITNNNYKWKSIISHHDFNQCLTFNNIKKLIEKMYIYGDIAKVAMTLQNAGDVSTMISILEDYNIQNKNIIFAPMNDKLTRLIAWKYGSWTNFVCLNEKQKTANGQLTWQEFEKLTCNFE